MGVLQEPSSSASRARSAPTRGLLDAINCAETNLRVGAERALLAELDGSCKTPIAGLAELSDGGKVLRLRGLVALPDGSRVHAAELTGPARDGRQLGQALGERLKAVGGAEFFAAITGH